MSHDALAIITTILVMALGFLLTLLINALRQELRELRSCTRLTITVLYHLVTDTELPEKIYTRLVEEMANGSREGK